MRAKQQGKKPVGGAKQIAGLPVIREKVAGIDIGSEQHWVCSPTVEGSAREVAGFGATTGELLRMADWLKERKVEAVAMESTGVYWIPPYEVLEGKGLEVMLVSTRQLASVPGRDKKSDPNDCEWIQRLHSCGLLQGSYRPSEGECMLRTLVRDQGRLVAESGDWLRRMQKNLDEMNVRVHRAVADLDGKTGMAILRAIVKGERDAEKLAQLRDRRCKKSEAAIAAELRGHWREDHLFSLRQGLKIYDVLQERIAEYEQEILRKLGEMEREECRRQQAPPLQNREKGRAIQKRGEEAMRQALYRACGVDLTATDGIGVGAVKVFLSEYGWERIMRFENEKQLVKHVMLAPNQPTSGGKPVKAKKRNSASTRVAEVLRMAATSLRHSDTALGAFYRQMARRKGADVAVFATARKLVVLLYRGVRWGKPYVDEGAAAYEKRYQENRLKSLKAKAKDLGYQLTPIQAQPSPSTV